MAFGVGIITIFAYIFIFYTNSFISKRRKKEIGVYLSLIHIYNINIVMAMNMGGDDFIPKPFDLEVLTAKIQALLRRSYDFAGNSSIMEHKGAVLNLMDATLTWAGQQLELTKKDVYKRQA